MQKQNCSHLGPFGQTVWDSKTLFCNCNSLLTFLQTIILNQQPIQTDPENKKVIQGFLR